MNNYVVVEDLSYMTKVDTPPTTPRTLDEIFQVFSDDADNNSNIPEKGDDDDNNEDPSYLDKVETPR